VIEVVGEAEDIDCVLQNNGRDGFYSGRGWIEFVIVGKEAT